MTWFSAVYKEEFTLLIASFIIIHYTVLRYHSSLEVLWLEHKIYLS